MSTTHAKGGNGLNEGEAMSNEATLRSLGKIIEGDASRDAVHIAVVPVVAGAALYAGWRVKMDQKGRAVTTSDDDDADYVGVVDPFLKDSVRPMNRFWLYLRPGSITSLRHEWTHPAFPIQQEQPKAEPAPGSREESRLWLEDFADRLFSYEPEYGSRFETLLHGVEEGVFGTDIEYGPDLNPSEKLWMHYERYTGKKITRRPEFFRCAC